MELLLVKILALCGVFVSMIIAALLPLRLITVDTHKQQPKFLRYSNCLAGGVFLGTCFIGLFPTVKSKFASVLNQNLKTDIPVAELTIMIGYFLMMFMEQLAHAFGGHDHAGASEMADSMEMKATVTDRGDRANGKRIAKHDSSDDEENEIYSREAHPLSEIDDHDHAHHGHSHLLTKSNSSLRQYMLLLALSVHSIFEGSALGLQETVAKAMHLFIAILMHEVLVAFAFGVSLAKRDLRRKAYIQMIIFFCMMIPIGVGIGIALGRVHGFAGELTSAITQGLAAGTFIYVVYMEILPNELDGGADNVWRILFVFVGFMIFSSLQFITILT